MRSAASAGASTASAASSARCSRFTPDEMAIVEATRAKALVGSAEQVAAKLRALANSLGLDELVINTWAHEPAVRRRSYALLAAQFGLTADPS